MAITNDDSIVTKGILRYFYNSIHTNLTNLLKKKVDIEDGKGLSTNDFTDAEKEKLEGLESYSLPTATDDTLGGIKTSYTESGQTYAVKTDVEGNAYVSVPWTDTDTEYEVVSTTSNGLAPMLPDVDDGSTYYLNGLGKWSVVSTDSYFSVTSAYISLSGIGFTFYKQGKVIICVFGGISSFSTGKYTKLTSNGIPSAYRPNAEVSGTGSVANNNTVQSSSRVYFKTNGEIGIITGVSGNQEYYGCACWTTSD